MISDTLRFLQSLPESILNGDRRVLQSHARVHGISKSTLYRDLKQLRREGLIAVSVSGYRNKVSISEISTKTSANLHEESRVDRGVGLSTGHEESLMRFGAQTGLYTGIKESLATTPESRKSDVESRQARNSGKNTAGLSNTHVESRVGRARAPEVPPDPPLRSGSSGTCSAPPSHEKPIVRAPVGASVKLLNGNLLMPFQVRIEASRCTLTLDDTVKLASSSPRSACRQAMLAGLADAIEASYIGRWAKATRRDVNAWRSTLVAKRAFARAARLVLNAVAQLSQPPIQVITRLLDMAEEPVKHARFAKYPTPLHLSGPRVESGLVDWIPPQERGEAGPMGIPDDVVAWVEPLYGNAVQFVQGVSRMCVEPYRWVVDPTYDPMLDPAVPDTTTTDTLY